MSQEGHPRERKIPRYITRRQALKAGGIAAVGLVFAKPLISTIYPKPAFANYIVSNPGPPVCTVPTLLNGNFESPVLPSNTHGTLIDDWVRAGLANLWAADIRGWTPNSPAGGQKVVLQANSGGSIEQVLATDTNCTYRVKFYLANHPQNPAPIVVQVSAAGVSQNYTTTVAPHGTFAWTQHTFDFTPVSSATTLKFLAVIINQTGGDGVIDGVTIEVL